MVLGAYVLIGIWTQNQNCQTNPGIKCYEVRTASTSPSWPRAGMGASFGFLWWNASPPRSSWATPGRSGSAASSPGWRSAPRTELLVVVLAGLFVLEVVSGDGSGRVVQADR
jgi:phospho-N-acetylmuramoyl-pentapeptide-transferase